jgi:hypothetical protein
MEDGSYKYVHITVYEVNNLGRLEDFVDSGCGEK